MGGGKRKSAHRHFSNKELFSFKGHKCFPLAPSFQGRARARYCMHGVYGGPSPAVCSSREAAYAVGKFPLSSSDVHPTLAALAGPSFPAHASWRLRRPWLLLGSHGGRYRTGPSLHLLLGQPGSVAPS